MDGGGSRTRTYEGLASGFTVRPLCRSGHSPMCQTMGTTAEDTGSRLSCEAPFAGGVMATRHRPVNSRPALSTACPDWRLPPRIFPAPERRADPPAAGGARPDIGSPGSGDPVAGEQAAVNAGAGGARPPIGNADAVGAWTILGNAGAGSARPPIGNAGSGSARTPSGMPVPAAPGPGLAATRMPAVPASAGLRSRPCCRRWCR